LGLMAFADAVEERATAAVATQAIKIRVGRRMQSSSPDAVREGPQPDAGVRAAVRTASLSFSGAVARAKSPAKGIYARARRA
jgi:hypothetical protein